MYIISSTNKANSFLAYLYQELYEYIKIFVMKSIYNTLKGNYIEDQLKCKWYLKIGEINIQQSIHCIGTTIRLLALHKYSFYDSQKTMAEGNGVDCLLKIFLKVRGRTYYSYFFGGDFIFKKTLFEKL